MKDLKRIGLIAGAGNMPVILARHMKERGIKVIALALKDAASRELDSAADRTYWLTAAELGKLPIIFLKERIGNIALSGKISKEMIFKQDFSKNKAASALLEGARDKKDETIFKEVGKLFQKFGVTLLNTIDLLPDLIVDKEVYTDRSPTQKEQDDLVFGTDMAIGIGKLDIGQTVIVKNKAVIAVEALEGTDEAIKRCGVMGIDGVVAVKMSKPGQDLRFDVPTVGLDTIKSLVEAKGSVMAMEAGKTFFVEREKSIKLANANGICILGI